MKKGTRKQRKEAFKAAYKAELMKQGILDAKKEEPVKKKTTKKKEEE